MTRFTRVQSAHSYGVLDPHVVERRDTKFVDGSLADGLNIVVMPQGGYTDRGGTDDFGRVRRQLAGIVWTAGQVSLPNGGSAAGLVAGETQNAGSVAGTRHVLVEIDFGAVWNVAFIDIDHVSVSQAGADAGLIAEYWTGLTWATFGSPLLITTTSRTRRFAGPMTSITASRFRICINAATGASGDATFSGLRLFAETGVVSSARLSRYHHRASEVHQIVLSDRNMDIFQAGSWVASVPLPAPEAILSEIKFEFGYDTILCFHRDMEPQKVTRLGAAGEWSCEPVIFDNLPLVDYGGIYTNGVNEVQEISLYNLNEFEAFQLIVEGKATAAITIPAGGAGLAAEIKTALEALTNVATGITVTGNYPTCRVEFSGDGNSGRDWLEMSGVALDNDGFVRVRTITEGKKPGEPVFSAARGWPAVGRLVQKRLVLAGFKSKPNSILASVTSAPFDMNTELGVATGAFLHDIGENEANTIRDILLAKTLIFFGSSQHAWLKNNVLSADDIPEFGFSDAPGIDGNIRPVPTNSAIFYIQNGANTLQMLSYTEIEQNFVGDNASVLSAHLIKSPVDITRRRSTEQIDSDLLSMVNADGSATVLTLMRSQEISGYAPWRTDGLFRSVQVDQNNDMWLLVERLADGVAEVRLEKLEPAKSLDEAETRNVVAPENTFNGLERFNGRKIWALTESEAYGPVTVAGGTAVFPSAISGAVRLGTWIAPFAIDPEVYVEHESGRRQARLKRVNRFQLSVIDTTSIAISANDGPVENLPLTNNGETILGQGPLERPFTGTVEAEGMHGFTKHGQATVTQTFPGRMTVRRASKDIVA